MPDTRQPMPPAGNQNQQEIAALRAKLQALESVKNLPAMDGIITQLNNRIVQLQQGETSQELTDERAKNQQLSDQHLEDTSQYWNPAQQDLQGLRDHSAQPGQGEQYWEGVQGRIGQGPQARNYAQDYSSQFMPGLTGQSYSEKLAGSGAGLDPYYDQQSARGSKRINNSLAAMGLFGSGANMEQLTEMETGLGAEQANREGDYNLRAAGQADDSMIARTNAGRDWANSMYDQGSGIDRANLDWMQTGSNMAFNAQSAGDARAQMPFNASMAYGQGRSGQDLGWYGDTMNRDYSMFGDQQNADNSRAQRDYSQAQSNEANNTDFWDQVDKGLKYAQIPYSIPGQGPPKNQPYRPPVQYNPNNNDPDYTL